MKIKASDWLKSRSQHKMPSYIYFDAGRNEPLILIGWQLIDTFGGQKESTSINAILQATIRGGTGVGDRLNATSAKSGHDHGTRRHNSHLTIPKATTTGLQNN